MLTVGPAVATGRTGPWCATIGRMRRRAIGRPWMCVSVLALTVAVPASDILPGAVHQAHDHQRDYVSHPLAGRANEFTVGTATYTLSR